LGTLHKPEGSKHWWGKWVDAEGVAHDEPLSRFKASAAQILEQREGVVTEKPVKATRKCLEPVAEPAPLPPVEGGLPDDLISALEASRLVGVGKPAIYAWIAQGRLRAWKMAGGYFRLSRRDVEALLVEVQPGPQISPKRKAGVDTSRQELWERHGIDC
jgi:excisionase family DNA binding protein